ncbi:hypothetical protein VPEG_00091 [Vibrio phage SIO-2]|uniref:hypothetical protein n=1 Tax=Vibrio phage SIO-2 TaxID=700512 RepID=UPI0002357C80|nr:hypothetical protein VPEG_00091 [Vibrio phage SIO-2]AET42241.1 hypothetical protein VPEG_00091 [Vibrio phage SIO-2]
MNTTDTLKQLLGIGSDRVSGRVIELGSVIRVATSSGTLTTPKPSLTLNLDDIVIIEGGQILYNVGNKTGITTYEL